MPMFLICACNITQIRLICKDGYFDHTANLFESLNILPFFHLMQYNIAISRIKYTTKCFL